LFQAISKEKGRGEGGRGGGGEGKGGTEKERVSI